MTDMKILRNWLLSWVLLLALNAFCFSQTNDFNFVVYGDSRTNFDISQKIVQLIDTYDDSLDLIFHTGDIVTFGYRIDEWERYFSILKIIKTPIYFAVGNHDTNQNEDASNFIRYAKPPDDQLYYAVRHKHALFLVLNSENTVKKAAIIGKQWDWLTKQLQDSTAQFKFMILHRPLYTEMAHIGDCLDHHPKERDQLQNLLVQHRVTMVFAGHNHYYSKSWHDGIPNITTGGGGAPLYTDDAHGGFYHIVLVNIRGSQVIATAIDLTGKVRDQITVTAAE